MLAMVFEIPILSMLILPVFTSERGAHSGCLHVGKRIPQALNYADNILAVGTKTWHEDVVPPWAVSSEGKASTFF